MFLLTVAPVFIFLIFGSQDVSSCEEQVCQANEEEPWSYGGTNGPENWGEIGYPQCNGRHQSPINFIYEEAEINRNLCLELENYEIPVTSATINNNGHTIQVTPNDGISRSIVTDAKGDGVREKYTLEQFHFHWGSQPKCGSEHQVNGRAASMEMHLVHMNSRNEIAVLGVFIFAFRKNNTAMNSITKLLPSVRYRNQQTDLKSDLLLSDLIPTELDFFRYNGSLTTPPCTEGVIWSVFLQPVKIGGTQLKEFRRLFSTTEDEEEKCSLNNNYRPIQDLNDRTVSFTPAKSGTEQK